MTDTYPTNAGQLIDDVRSRWTGDMMVSRLRLADRDIYFGMCPDFIDEHTDPTRAGVVIGPELQPEFDAASHDDDLVWLATSSEAVTMLDFVLKISQEIDNQADGHV